MAAPIRILTAVPICDGHDSAINTINLEFIRHGIEVIYLGYHRSVGDIVRAAIQEDVRAIGISSYNGGHIEFFVAVVDLLRKKGAASAAKKADREAKDGVIAQAILPGAKVGVLVEVNCETDFVAKNDLFKNFTDEIARKIDDGSLIQTTVPLREPVTPSERRTPSPLDSYLSWMSPGFLLSSLR